jgi:hypothetical protein
MNNRCKLQLVGKLQHIDTRMRRLFENSEISGGSGNNMHIVQNLATSVHLIPSIEEKSI